jgi:hypothetical protein
MSLPENRRSVCENAPLQNQFSERNRTGWPGIESGTSERHFRRRRRNQSCEFELAVTETGKGVCEMFGGAGSDCAQDFATR